MAFLSGFFCNISKAQSINAYQYSRANQANAKMFVDKNYVSHFYKLTSLITLPYY